MEKKQPICLILIGMAGSGKSTFMQRLIATLFEQKKKYYVVNLDPAVMELNYKANIDIRDALNFKDVMKHYKLGPNGAIITSLNLFATQFHEVLHFLESRAAMGLDYILIDTPGQLETFSWS